jgi:lipopolysaccharide export system protein LptA
MRATLAAVSLCVLAGSIRAQNVPRTCDLEFPNRPGTHATIVDEGNGKRRILSGGGILAHCTGQGNTLTADSAEYYEGEGRLLLIGNVHYTEPRVTVDSRTMTYYQGDDHLHAEGDVVAVMSNGSTLRGPSADYYRSTPQRPQARIIAPGRPRVTLVQRDTSGRGKPPDTANVVANTITMVGDSLVYASRRVQITRPDLVAAGDSAFLDSGRDFARLLGEPSVQGKSSRPFTLTGGVIDVYSRNRQVERVVATPSGHALSQDLELVADSIDLRVQGNQLQRAIAWGKGTRARAVSPEREIVADSIDAIMPSQRVREVRAVRNAFAESNPDSGVVSTQRDWMRGDTIVALFDTLAARDTSSKPRIRQIIAQGSARSLYQMKSSKGPATAPTVNYVRGRIIRIDFEDRKVATVTVIDRAIGVLIEPAAASATPPGTAPKPVGPSRPPGVRR